MSEQLQSADIQLINEFFRTDIRFCWLIRLSTLMEQLRRVGSKT
jgi:hypothetical protein